MPDPGPPSPLPRLETSIPGLDVVLDGGLVAGVTCLVVGSLGSGKTTLGNQVVFHHARGGGHALFATVLAESHERMLRRLARFRFFDAGLVGERVHYLNLLDTLDDGPDALLAAVRREVRLRGATLLVLDGMPLVEELVAGPVELRRFVHRLQVTTGLAGCTTLLLGGHDGEGNEWPVGVQVDGVLRLDLVSEGARDRRRVRVVKFRGAEHLLGHHDLSITAAGVAVFPRLEAVVGHERIAEDLEDRLSVGVSGLDRMLGGGLLPRTSTLILGTPGSGKTITGLHFLAAGAVRGERGLIATFHENTEELARTTAPDLQLATAMENGLVEVFWRPALEFSTDGWAWELLDLVDRHQPVRLFLDGVSDLDLSLPRERMPLFLTALVNELRRRGVTTVGTVEIDAFVGPELASPVPAISAMVDNGILLRHVEIRSRLHRLVSVLKARQSATDPEIREFTIDRGGIEIGEPFLGAAGLLTGAAYPEPPREPDLWGAPV